MAYWHAAKEIVHPIYKYRFRSLLEARHAVFIEALGFRYEYETYQASDGSKRYWIDFYLPDVAQYYEVKPDRNALMKIGSLLLGTELESWMKTIQNFASKYLNFFQSIQSILSC